jgi:HAD superfamily hydrolase (TIGR01549 family)
MSSIQAVIFDIDGTLLDSNDAHARAFEAAFLENGRPYPYLEIRRLIGMGGDNLIPTLSGLKKESPKGKRISHRKKEVFFSKYFSQLCSFPKVRELMSALKDRGMKISIATSASQDELKQFLKLLEIEEFLDAHTHSDDVESSKPDPDVIRAALKKLNFKPNQVIMIGDTPYDIEAASRAGVKTIALRCGGYWKDQDLSGAIAIYDNPHDFLKNLDHSPLFIQRETNETLIRGAA